MKGGKPTERSELFLSCDLVGSTAYKQRESQASRTSSDGGTGAHGAGLRRVWQQTFMDFYRTFPQMVGELEVNANKHLPDDRKVHFELWKPIGDELIFTVHVQHEKQVSTAVDLWLDALDMYARNLEPFNMSTKGAAFIATFPGPDSEVAVPREPGQTPSQDENVILLNDAAFRGQRKMSKFVYDYFGPSIDTGFRISNVATPRYFPISVEVAWALLIAQSDTQTRKWDDLVYRGGHEFKGVWSGRDYPLFAIDRHHADDVNAAVHKLIGDKLDIGNAIELCQSCAETPDWPSHIFLSGSGHDPFINKPGDPLKPYREASDMTGVERNSGGLGNEELPDVTSFEDTPGDDAAGQ